MRSEGLLEAGPIQILINNAAACTMMRYCRA